MLYACVVANIGIWVVLSLSFDIALVSAQPYPDAISKLEEITATGPFGDRGDSVLWQREFRQRGSAYLRLVFDKIQSPPGASYSVVLRGGDERVLARYSARQFSVAPILYTDVLPTDTIRVELQGGTPLNGLSFRINRVLYQVDLQGRTSALSQVPDWRNVMDLAGVPEATADLVTRAREAVAKIYMASGAVCTAFLVSPSRLLTNFHCLEESSEYNRTRNQDTPSCADIEVQFDFNRQTSLDTVIKARCERILRSDKSLDFALLELDPRRVSPPNTIRRFLPLANRAVADREELMVLHHPGGLAKQFSFACRAFPVNADLVEHDCSTIPGSSGAALIARDGTVIGLHYAGPYEDTMTIGEINTLVRRGQVFRNKAKPALAVRNRLSGLLP